MPHDEQISTRVSIGEIGRSLARLEAAQGRHEEKLDEIKEQTLKTNGYVGRHEERLNGLDREVRDLKGRRPGSHELKRASDRPDAITVNVPINAKTIAALLAAAAALAAAAWQGGLL